MLEFHGGLNDGVEYFMGLKMEIVGFSWDFIGIHGDSCVMEYQKILEFYG